MYAVSQSQIDPWDGLIKTLARKRCKMAGIDYDDLCQEGYLSVITSYAMGSLPTEQTIVNSMRRYLRSVRGGKSITYEPRIEDLL